MKFIKLLPIFFAIYILISCIKNGYASMPIFEEITDLGQAVTKTAATPFVVDKITESSEKTIKGENMLKEYEANYENVKPLGRTHFINDMLWCAFSGTGAEFTFTGTKAEITVAGDSTAMIGSNSDNFTRIAIYADGARVIDDMINMPEKTYTVFESDIEKTVTITVVKLSETAMSTFVIKKIAVVSESGIKPTPEKDYFIEFLGDSITCGYGIDDEDRDHHFKTSTEDVTKAYAYKTAKALDADYSIVAISGYGIISGYSSDGKTKSASQIIPDYYTKLGFSYGILKGTQASSINWDFSKRQPDIIVINLGTNDDSYCQDDWKKQNEFQDSYTEFLKQVRDVNPDSIILCTLGIIGSRLYPYIEKAVTEFTAATGDANIFTMRFKSQLGSDGYAADWHPTEKTNIKAAEKLTEQIKALLNIH